MKNTELSENCDRVAELSREAIDWLSHDENEKLVGKNTAQKVKALRRVTRRARKLARSARTRMSVSVFGPSQAGKSFLVSVMARPENGELFAAYDAPDGTLNYLKEVNPEGQGESTGLVTRFTMAREKTPEGYPIKLTLLSEADIIRTIMNSFFSDGDGSETPPEQEDFASHFKQFSAKAETRTEGLTSDDVLEIGEYVERVFRRSAYADRLKAFWEDAAEIAPRLTVADRAAFFQIAWGNHAPLSELYLRLSSALADLNHASEIYAGLDALVPRETSIIDVKTLRGLSGADVGPPLQILTAEGAQATLDRAALCALAAEMTFPMKEQPSEVFSDVDLLDFPGARNRFDTPLSARLSVGDVGDALRELLLRGKVAYLFDRYVENQEITSMLLCIPGSNMDTVSLPGLVENWIALTHGDTPATRVNIDPVLFFVLTKFDELLIDSGADGGAQTRFTRRMEASLLEKFTQGSDNWVEEWTPGNAFKNCFWLRNPKYPAEAVINYEDGFEVSLRTDKAARLAELKAGCIAAPFVERHFANPADAWEAAMSLNDGGVHYLTQALTRVAKPDNKIRQINAQLRRLITDVAGELQEYFVSDDVEKRISEKRQSAARIIDGIEMIYNHHRFGTFLRALMVDQDQIETLIARIPGTVRIATRGAVAPAADQTKAPWGDAPKAVGGLARPSGLARPQGLAQQTSPANIASNGVAASPKTTDPAETRALSMAEFQAETALSTWSEGLRRLRDGGQSTENLGLDDAALSDLSLELLHAARRTGMFSRLVTLLEQTNFGLSAADQAPPAAIICAEEINHFVSTLGAEQMPDNERPKTETPNGELRPVFGPRVSAETADTLPAEIYPSENEYTTDWIFALEAMVVANAKDGSNGTVNVEQNLKLGQILTGLTEIESMA
ncbi:MAG: virulence factor SrfC family protein [Pseudomonadota bacterium]